MASVAGQARFGIFEITPVGLPMAVAGGLYLFLAGSRLLNATERDDYEGDPSPVDPLHIASAQVGDASLFTDKRPFLPATAATAFAVFFGAIALVALHVALIHEPPLRGTVIPIPPAVDRTTLW